MPRPLVRPTLAALLLALAPGSAGAAAPAIGVPDPANSTVPACITLVGSNGIVGASMGTFHVIVRDLAQNPVPGTTVTVDLSNVTDMGLCSDQLDPNVVVDCSGRRVSATTDQTGTAIFTLLGSGRPGGARTLAGTCHVYWEGTFLASPALRAFDADGASGVGANDFSLWFDDFLTGLPLQRSDYDCSGSVGANDLSVWLGAFGSGAQTVSCAATCP